MNQPQVKTITVGEYKMHLVESIAKEVVCRSISRYVNETNQPTWAAPNVNWVMEVAIKLADAICEHRWPSPKEPVQQPIQTTIPEGAVKKTMTVKAKPKAKPAPEPEAQPTTETQVQNG